MGILICGLNGAGKSTLGKALAERLGYEFIDNEDLYFPKTDPAYSFACPRSREEAVRLLEERIAGNDRFVFAAVKGDYGDKLAASLDHVVLIEVPKGRVSAFPASSPVFGASVITFRSGAPSSVRSPSGTVKAVSGAFSAAAAVKIRPTAIISAIPSCIAFLLILVYPPFLLFVSGSRPVPSPFVL